MIVAFSHVLPAMMVCDCSQVQVLQLTDPYQGLHPNSLGDYMIASAFSHTLVDFF